MLEILVALLLADSVPSRLAAELVLTNRPGQVFMRWGGAERLTVEGIHTARRGEPIATLVMFSDCSRNQAGNCDVRMDISVSDPTGKVYGVSKGTEVWVDKPAPAAGVTELADGYMMIEIEPNDPPGRYTVKVDVTDHVSGAVLQREASFDVPPLQPGDSVEWPAGRPKPNLSGFWKDHCEDDFGLKIAPVGEGLYSISFCGPGGCFEPGTYRPNSAILGDQAYRVKDADTLEVLGGDGFTTYYRCRAPTERK